jgi:integrase
MTDRLLDRLIARYATRRSEVFVFPNRGGKPNGHLDRFITSLAEKAGVNLNGRRLVHDWRKTFATRMKNEGVDLYDLKDLLGHTS